MRNVTNANRAAILAGIVAASFRIHDNHTYGYLSTPPTQRWHTALDRLNAAYVEISEYIPVFVAQDSRDYEYGRFPSYWQALRENIVRARSLANRGFDVFYDWDAATREIVVNYPRPTSCKYPCCTDAREELRLYVWDYKTDSMPSYGWDKPTSYVAV